MKARYRNVAGRVARQAPALLVYLDADLRVRFANQHLCELLGHSPQEVRGRLLAELLDPATLKYALEHKAQIERGNLEPRDYVLRDKRGQRRYVQVRASLDRDERGRGIGIVACTADNAAERETRRALERLSFALSASAAGVWYWDLAADTVHYSPEFRALLGYAQQELPPEFTFFAALHPDEAGAVFDAVANAIQEGGSFDHEFRMRRADGGYRWLRGVGRALRDPASGVVTRFAGSVRDIAPRKQAELRLREANDLAAATVDGCLAVAELAERRRLDRVRRELLDTANHELRTPLASIIAALDLLRDGATPEAGQAASAFVAVALENAERLARVVEQWLDVERIDLGLAPIRREPYCPAAVMADAVANGAAFAAERSVRVEPCGKLITGASGDGPRLKHALTHLLHNAIERSPREGVVRLLLTAHEERVHLLVEDQCADALCGLDLGVSLAKAVIERLGGTLSFGARDGGGGAAFRVELPLAA